MDKLSHYKSKVRNLAKEALKHGKIERRNACEMCGSDDKLFMHHDDYTKPYDVKWLCKNCHWGGLHNHKSPLYKSPVIPDKSVYSNTDRRNKSKCNHNYKIPDIVKDMLKYRKLKFSEWCRLHGIKDSQVRNLFAKRVTGCKGVHAEIWLLLDKEFPGWNHHINYYDNK